MVRADNIMASRITTMTTFYGIFINQSFGYGCVGSLNFVFCLLYEDEKDFEEDERMRKLLQSIYHLLRNLFIRRDLKALSSF